MNKNNWRIKLINNKSNQNNLGQLNPKDKNNKILRIVYLLFKNNWKNISNKNKS